jgi:hypothetical protein
MISSEAVKEALQGNTNEFLEKIPDLAILAEAVKIQEHVNNLFQRLLTTPDLLAKLVLNSKNFDTLTQLEANATGGSYQKLLFNCLLTNHLLFFSVTKNTKELHDLTFAIRRAVRKSHITETDASNLRNNLIMKLLEQPDEYFFQIFHPNKNSRLEQLDSNLVQNTCGYYPEAAQALFDKEFDLVFPLIISELTDDKDELKFSSILRLLWDESEDMYLRFEVYTPRIYNKYRELMFERMKQLHNEEYKDWISEHLKCLAEHEPHEIKPRKTTEEAVSSEQATLLAASVSKVFDDSQPASMVTQSNEPPAVTPLSSPTLKVN